MGDVVPMLYSAKLFESGPFKTAGTLCGHIDFATPGGTHVLNVDELDDLVAALLGAREDVIRNSRPLSDPRLYDE